MTAICSKRRERWTEVLLTPAQRLDLLLALDGRPGRAAAQALQPRRPARAVAARAPVQRARAGPAPRRSSGRRGWRPVERLDPKAVAVRRRFRMAMAFLAPDGQRPARADRGAPGRSGALGDHQRRHPGPRVPPAHLAVPGLAPGRRARPATGLARHDQPGPGRAGRDPDPVPRLRRARACSTATSPSTAMPA